MTSDVTATGEAVMMSTHFIWSVGTSADPIEAALREAALRGSATVWLLYGRPYSGQTPSPLDTIERARRVATGLGLTAETREASKPDDLAVCIEDARLLLRAAIDRGATRLVVDYTGGTKVLASALVHAALTLSASVEVVLEYVSGDVKDAQGRTVREAMRVEQSTAAVIHEHAQRVLSLLRLGDFARAHLLASELPDDGRNGFVRRAAERLAAWDACDYDPRALRPVSDAATALTDDPGLGWLAAVLRAAFEAAKTLHSIWTDLASLSSGGGKLDACRNHRVEGFARLVSDTLARAQRRRALGEHTDAVLLAYRAIEVASQGAAILSGVNPWQPAWETRNADEQGAIRDRLGATELPKKLALTHCLRIALPSEDVERVEADVTRVGDLRNRSYLAHGYGRCTAADAEDACRCAEQAAARVLGLDTLPVAPVQPPTA